MHIRILFAFLLLPITFVSAQSNCDSLKKVWRNNSIPKAKRYKAITKLANECHYYAAPDSARAYAEQYLKFARSNKDTAEIVKAHIALGNALYTASELPEAKKHLEKALSFKDVDPLLKMVTLVNLATVEDQLGDLKSAIIKYTDALTIADKLKDEGRRATILINIGTAHYSQNDLQKAIQYFEEAYRYYAKNKSGSNGRVYSVVCSNMVNVLIALGEKKKAQEFVDKMMSHARKTNEPNDYAHAFMTRSIVHNKTGKKQSALEALDSVVHYSSLLKEDKFNYLAQVKRSEIYLELKQASKAQQFGLKAYQLLPLLPELENRITVTELLYKAYKQEGKFDKALKYHEEFLASKDSLVDKEEQREIIRQEYKYQYQKEAIKDSIEAAEAMRINQLKLSNERARNRQNELEKQTQQISIYFLIFALILTGIIIFLVFRAWKKSKAEKEQVLTELENRKNRLITFSIHIRQKMEFFENFKNDIKDLNGKTMTKKEINALTLLLNHQMSLSKDFAELNAQIEQLNQQFFEELKNRCDNLSKNDLRIAAYLRLEMSTKDISMLMNIEPNSVDVARYRLRRKLGLEKGDDLTAFIKDL